MKVKILLLLGLLIFSVAICGCMGEGKSETSQIKTQTESKVETTKSDKIKIIDCAGREVEVPRNAKRIVTLWINCVWYLAELNATDRLVGIDDYAKKYMFGEMGKKRGHWFIVNEKRYPHLKNLPDVGSYRDPNTELIRSLNPDVILVNWRSKETADMLQKKLGIPVVCIGGPGREYAFKSYRILGKILDKEDRAEELINYYKEKYKVIESRLPKDKKQKVFFCVQFQKSEVSLQTLMRYPPIEDAGGVEIRGEWKGKTTRGVFAEIPKEFIADWNPDVILIYARSKDKLILKVEDILNDPILKPTNAVKNKKVYYHWKTPFGYDPAHELWATYYIAKLLYPDKFKDIDMRKEGNEILKKFYGFDDLYDELCDHVPLYQWE